MKKTTLSVLLCTMLATGITGTAFAQKKSTKTPVTKTVVKKKRPDKFTFAKEAIEFEFRATRDPKLNVVPRERLMPAIKEIERRNEQRLAGISPNAPIPGVNWIERGPNNIGGRTRTMLVDPNDATGKRVFAAGVDGGLWRTNDITLASPTWTIVNDFFTNMAITSMAAHPAAPLTMYFGTGEGWLNADAVRGLGIWKSTDGGTTFTQLAATNNNANFYYCQKVVVKSNGFLFAGTSTGLWRSTDGGLTFTNVLAGFISDVEISSTGRLHVSKGRYFTAGNYQYSDNDGTAWTTPASFGTVAGSVYRVELAVAPNNANFVYAMCQSGAGAGLSRIMQSTNAGVTWAAKALPTDADPGIGADITRGQAWYDLTIAVDPTNANTVYCGGVDLFKSTNGATSWAQITHWYGGFGFQNVHADQHCIIFRNQSGTEIYFGNDGGVYRTANGTVAVPTITAKNTGPIGGGYRVTQLYSCAISPTLTNYFLAGAQDNGSFKYAAAGINNVTTVTGGDGAFCFIDQNNNNNQLTSYVYNNFYRSTDAGVSFGAFATDNTGLFINPGDLDNTNDILYTARAANEVLRWNAIFGATTKTVITSAALTTAMGGGQASHIKVSPNTPTTIYVGTTNGRVVRVAAANTAAPVITNITGAAFPVGGYVSCVEVQPGNENNLIVTFSNYGVNSVWQSTNAGVSWVNKDVAVVPAAGALPDMPVRWAIFNPNNANQVYLATELGVWSCDNITLATPNWGQNSSGLGNVRTDMLKVRLAGLNDRLIAVATHGRGLYTLSLPCNPPCAIPASDPGTDIKPVPPLENGQAPKPGASGNIWIDNNSNTLHVQVPPDEAQYSLVLVNMNGVAVKRVALRAGQQLNMPLAELPSGMYLANLLQNQKALMNKKITVNK